MAVHEIFPTAIVINDLDLSEEKINDLRIAVNSIFLHNYGMTREQAYIDGGSNERGNYADTIPVFNEENMEVFPVLRELKEIIIDGFYELAQCYENNNLSREDISALVASNLGQLPILRKTQSMTAHIHPGTVASALFYLTDIDNEKEGGQLVLRDPSWHATAGFRNSLEYEVETKAGRLVVFPTHIWHEVKNYLGDKDRISVVTNLCPLNEIFLKSLCVEGL